MSEPTPDSLIPYDEIVQEALRAVVGQVLGEVGSTGMLPGDITSTSPSRRRQRGGHPAAPVRALSRRDDDRHPEPLLGPQGGRGRLRSGAGFNQAPAKLFIPFAAITGFVDPAVNFALQFQAQSDEAGLQEHEAAENDPPSRRAGGRRIECRLGGFQPEEMTAPTGRHPGPREGRGSAAEGPRPCTLRPRLAPG